MKNRFIKILVAVIVIFIGYFLVNSTNAIEVYDYKTVKYITGIPVGSTINSIVSNYFGSYETLKEIGIDVSESVTPAQIENIVGNFSTSKGVAYTTPGSTLKTGDHFTDKNGVQYTFILDGDVNQDGKVNTIDLILMRRYLLYLDVDLTDSLGVKINKSEADDESTKLFEKIADMDKDGNFKVNDLTVMKKALVAEGLDISEVSGDLDFDGICNADDYKIMLDVKNGKYYLTEQQKENSEYFDGMTVEQLEEYINKELNIINN